ncbi:MAG TPA: hypothetical protein PK957_03165 [Candidatus Dojkabacteria bacterium]|nr:hypothetical protein [Candidatus Dojkabacteria bacterium]HQF37253.1 hypothetical protein [Candidatus Dojkabacteria bacterium]
MHDIFRHTDSPHLDPQIDFIRRQILVSLIQNRDGTGVSYSSRTSDLLPIHGLENPPPAKITPIDIKLLQEIGVDTNQIYGLLSMNQFAEGSETAPIYSRGSLARTVLKKLDPNYEIPVGSYEFSSEKSDIDVTLSQKAKNLFRDWGTLISLPDPRYGTVIAQRIRCLPPNEFGDKYDVDRFKVSGETEIHNLQILHAFFPWDPVIKFYTENNQLRAELIRFKEESPYIFDPQKLGMHAYTNASNYIAKQMHNPDMIDPLIIHQIRATRPDLALLQAMKDWTQNVETELENKDVNNPATPVHLSPKLDEETRLLSLTSLSAVNSMKRNIATFEQNPPRAIYYLGSTGILSLALQSAMFLGETELIIRICDLFIKALSSTSDQAQTNSVEFHQLEPIRSMLKQRGVNLNIELRTPDYTYFPPSPSQYKEYMELAMNIAELSPFNYMGTKEIERKKLSETWIGMLCLPAQEIQKLITVLLNNLIYI